MAEAIDRLRAAGVSVWLDDLSRERLTSGSLAALARGHGVSGVTTNPTIFAKAITDSDAYDGQIRDLRLRQAIPDQALRELTTFDVRQACDAVEDHGRIPDDSIHGSYEQSQAVLNDLAAFGVDYDDVVQTLEDRRVAAFDASWDHLGQRLAAALSPAAGHKEGT